MPYKSSSGARDVDPTRFGLRMVRAMQPSAERGQKDDCVATHSCAVSQRPIVSVT